MTVPVTPPTITYQYQGPKNYDFFFLTYRPEDIEVSYSNTDGIASVLGASDYTVTLSEESDGGYVTTTSPTEAVGLLTIRRVLAIEQDTDWINNDPLDTETLETTFDRVVMMIQQLDVAVSSGAVVLSWRGEWLPDTDYVLRDIVTEPDTGNWYYAIQDHTSDSTSIQTDIDAGYWVLALDMEMITDLVSQAAQSEYNARMSAEAAAASEDIAVAAADTATSAEANAAMSEINAANCATEASQSAAESKQYRDEAAAIVAAGRVVDVVDENYYTATSGQTTFAIYPPTPQQYLLVFMNSRKLRTGEDFTTDNPILATQITLTSGASVGDEIDITLFNSIDGSA